jgi:hypothetical protein
LAQPVWLDGQPETYQYPKLGTSYDAATYMTQFDESHALVATSSMEFQAHVAAAKADPSIDAIYLNPAAGVFAYPTNLMSGLNRPVHNPLVIRTLPGAAQQARLEAVLENKFFQGVAFVDLNLSAGFAIHGGGQDILIERCVGSFDLQGNRSNGVPTTPLSNLQFRLNLVADAWAPSAQALVHGLFVYNVNGLLLEGNIVDHNGWNPAATRATPPDQGGATTRKHNIYIARPGSGNVARFNYISRASSHGIHFRNGGHLHDNLFVRNPISWQYGYGGDGNADKYGLTPAGVVENNITLDSDDINTSTGDIRGVNGWITNATGVTIDDNIAIDNTTSPGNDAHLQLDVNFPVGATISNNVSIHWPGDLRMGRGSASLSIVESGNNFQASGLTPSAQQLADQLKSDAYISSLKTSRARLGVDIGQLKANMSAIRAGIIA